MKRLLAWMTVNMLLASLWILRRVDHYFLGSSALRPDDDFRRDPYTSFNILRGNGPVLRSLANRGWIVLGYKEVRDALTHGAFSSDFTRSRFVVQLANAASGDKPFPLIENPPLLNQDPPNHTRLRKLASQGFVNRYIQSLEPTIERQVNELLDAVGDRTTFDVVRELAEPLPAFVIAEMMGVPEVDRYRFLAWSHALTGATMLTRPDLMAKAADAESEMRDYLGNLVAMKQRNPGEDLISKLVLAESEQDSLSRSEVISTCILLLTAGHETTTRLIGNGLFTLMQHPDQFDQLLQDRSLLDNTIEEILRYEPPVQETVRFIAEDTVFHGHRMKRGQMVLVNFAAANRDPAANPRPDQFTIDRTAPVHVSFGHGIHLCLGLALARLEARVVFNALLDRYQQFKCVEEDPPWQLNPFFRGLDHLHVKVYPRSGGP
ncbi:MAG: cytochrome P450 [Pseudomonadales bacterium]